MKYLELLDISNNKLITISQTIFGIQRISSNLKIYAGSNNWHCDCLLQRELNEIFAYHNSKLDMFCASPEEYKNWMVFDERICSDDGAAQPPSMEATTTTTKATTTTFRTTTSTTRPTTSATIRTTTSVTTPDINFLPSISTASTVNPDEIVPLECLSANNYAVGNFNSQRQSVRWPQINFIPTYFGGVTVKISVEQNDGQSSLGVFWFSKTTKEYYMMELLPDEFGLGCYFTVPLHTIVTNLIPNAAYTFCLVDDGHNSVSPFSCKSVQVGGNLNTSYNSWSSSKMLASVSIQQVAGLRQLRYLYS